MTFGATWNIAAAACMLAMASVNLNVKPKRMSYTVGFKLQVVEFAEKSGNRSAGREYSVSEKLVRDWRKKKTDLTALPKLARSQRLGVKAHWPDLENKLQEWVLDKRLNGIGVSGTMIRLKARDHCQFQLGPAGTVQGEVSKQP